MTNKLRSVIDETNKYIDRRSCRRDFLDRDMLLDTEEAKEILNESFTKLLDAIIEEIEEQEKTFKQHIDEMKKLNYTEDDIDFHRGKIMCAIDLSQELKQAREEIFTSTAQ